MGPPLVFVFVVDEEVVSLPVVLSPVDVSLPEEDEEEDEEEEEEEDEEDEDEDEDPSVSVVVVSVVDSCSVTVSVVVVELDVSELLALRVVELEPVALALVAAGCSPSDVL